MSRHPDGWCWLTDKDGAQWGIFGRHDADEARRIIEDYQEARIGPIRVVYRHQRAIPIRGWCPQCGADGKHYHYVDSAAGRGAFLVTFVYLLEQT